MEDYCTKHQISKSFYLLIGDFLRGISVAVVELVSVSKVTTKKTKPFYTDTNMGEEQRVIKPHNTVDGSCMFLIAYCQEDKKCLEYCCCLGNQGRN